MDPTTSGEQNKDRKRKLKFSEKEIETLIEDVADNHDKLFGKLSLKVPESVKRKIWLRIQGKVNAVGVTHRSIDDLKKRWYDLRNRAKERIAERLKSAKQTGGGAPTQTENMAMDDLVEATLQPEAVVGVTVLDTSGGTHTTEDAEEEGAEDSDIMDSQNTPAVDEAEAPVVQQRAARATRTSRTTVAPLQPMESVVESEGTPHTSQVPAPVTPTPPPPPPPRNVTASSSRRPARSVVPVRDDHSTDVWGGLEAQMLRVQRLQAKNMRGVHGQIRVMAGNIAGLTDCVRELTAAVVEGTKQTQKLTKAIGRAQVIQTRHHRQLMQRLHVYAQANNRVATNTAVLARRCVHMQVELSHCSVNVAKTLSQVTQAVELFHADNVVSGNLMAEEGSEGASSLSSVSVTLPTSRRHNTRSSTPSGTSARDPEEPAEKHLGVRGRKR